MITLEDSELVSVYEKLPKLLKNRFIHMAMKTFIDSPQGQNIISFLDTTSGKMLKDKSRTNSVQYGLPQDVEYCEMPIQAKKSSSSEAKSIMGDF